MAKANQTDEGTSDWAKRSEDVLENLSCFHSRCLFCGRENVHTMVKEKDVAWCECSCGHVYPVRNKIQWS